MGGREEKNRVEIKEVCVCVCVCGSSYFSQKALVFGEKSASVLHRHVQSPPVKLHHGDTELKPGGERGRKRGEGPAV